MLLWLALPLGALALSADESLLLDRVREIAAAPVDDFTLLGQNAGVRDGLYRYQLAFLGYGLCSIMEGEPGLRAEGRTLFTRLIEKMERPATLAYWKARGYGGDGVGRDNAMYRGHLNLMYGLAHECFGETRFDARFHALSRALFDEIGGERPVCCEPGEVFVQCNSVIILSLCLHDRAFGTDYGAAGKRLLAWAHERMPLAGTTLVRDDYQASTGKSSTWRAGCANAWVIAFLAPVPGLEADARAMYTDWRRTFAEPWGLIGIVKGAPADEDLSMPEMLASSLLATTFGLMAAREEGDEQLHRRLEWTVACADRLAEIFEDALPGEWRTKARAWRTIALSCRAFRGWSQVPAIRHSLPPTGDNTTRKP